MTNLETTASNRTGVA